MNHQEPKILRHILPTFGHLMFLAGLIAILLYGRIIMNVDGDLALHLNVGEYILNTGKIPLQDIFSHTMAGQPVMQHEWLSTIIFAFLKRVFAFNGIIVLCALLIATTLLLLFKQLRNDHQLLLPTIIAVLFVLVNSIIHWLARPHLFTFLMLTLWMITMENFAKGKFHLWWVLPVLMLVWVNLHGGFFIGFVTWFTYGFGIGWDALFNRFPKEMNPPKQFWKFYILGGIGSFLTSLINPSGIDLWGRIIHHVGNKYLADTTQEFQSPNFHNRGTWTFLVSIALLLLIIGLSKKRIKASRLFNVILWLILALYSVRNIPLFAIITAPLLGACLSDLLSNSASKPNFLTYIKNLDRRLSVLDKQLKGTLWTGISILIIVLVLSSGLNFDITKQGYAFDPEVFPIDAVSWLQENPQEGNMFNNYKWGGYLQLNLWPEEKVFVDSKADFYGEQFIRQYRQVMFLEEGWEQVLDQYEVSWAIIPADEPVSKALEEELGWNIIYEDDTAVILRRQ